MSVEKPVAGGKSEHLSKFSYTHRLLDCPDQRDRRSTLNHCAVNELAIGRIAFLYYFMKETPVPAGALSILRSVSAPAVVVS